MPFCANIFVWTLFAVVLYHGHIYGAQDSETDSKQDLDGEFLLEMGLKFNNPLLKLLGTVVLKGERTLTERLCRLHPCSPWGEWSLCSEMHGYGMATRERRCYTPTATCNYVNHTESTASESRVCEGACPAGYVNASGLCLKLNQTRVTQFDAEVQCVKESAHIVNINTQAVSDAVHDLLGKHNHTTTIWINGNRTATGSNWTFTYGASATFDNWEYSEPTNGSNELCMVEDSSPRKWFDRQCTDIYPFVCEFQHPGISHG